jgi:3-mercaptopyruvate sulfurtransferase SseA
VALLLRRQGVKRIRPLEGGLDGWREAGYKLQTAASVEVTDKTGLAQIKA